MCPMSKELTPLSTCLGCQYCYMRVENTVVCEWAKAKHEYQHPFAHV